MGYALRRMWLPQRVASLRWNQWQLCRGMRDNFTMESVASFAWNQWQLSYGTGGNFRMERVATFARNTQCGTSGHARVHRDGAMGSSAVGHGVGRTSRGSVGGTRWGHRL